MVASVSDWLVTDDLTILLGLIAGTVFLLRTFYRAQPLVHPILLGRQSEVTRVRNPGESAVYRNYGTGLMNRFPVRPHKDVHILADLVRSEVDTPRTLWNTKITNAALQDRVASFGTGLIRLAGLQPQESNVLLLLNDCFEFIVADLALSSHSIPSFTLATENLLSPILDSHPPSAIITHADLLPTLLELIYDAGEGGRHHTIVVVGEPGPRAMASVASKVKVLLWADVEREGVKIEKILNPLPKPTDIFSVSFFADSHGQIQGAQLTHANITAGVAATHALFPAASALSPLDTIVSAHSLSGAYGRAIAYTAIFEGTSFSTMKSSNVFSSDEVEPKKDVSDVLSAVLYPIPSPTVLYLKTPHLVSLTESILREAKKSFILNSFAWRHKIAGITEGFISKDSLWDRLVYDGARARVIGEGAGTVRAVVVEGSLPAPALTPARIAFSCPIVTTLAHPAVVGPVFASHPLDLQDFSAIDGSDSMLAPVGPPTVSIEAKLFGVNDDDVEGGEDPVGVLSVRGPPVAKLLLGEETESTNSDYVDVRASGSVSAGSSNGSGEEDEAWLNLGFKARVHTNGAFRVVA